MDASAIKHLTFRFLSDPGHGWLIVPTSIVKQLGVCVTAYSTKHEGRMYLEEDCDAPEFIRVFTEKYGVKPAIREEYTEIRPEWLR